MPRLSVRMLSAVSTLHNLTQYEKNSKFSSALIRWVEPRIMVFKSNLIYEIIH